jgi:hypothetical protein
MLINEGTPGSPCYLGHLANNTEFTKNPVCTASRTYQKLKLEALKAMGLSKEEYEKEAAKVTAKSCICAQLGDGVYKNENLNKPGGMFPAVCPGPNIAYFNRPVSLKEMIDHIYGRTNIMPFKNRPNMFVKELRLNIEQFEKLVKEKSSDKKNDAGIEEFRLNLTEGVTYYRTLFPQIIEETDATRQKMLEQLDECAAHISRICAHLPPAPVKA